MTTEQNGYLERIADALERFVNEKIESDKVLTGILNTFNREETKWTEGDLMAKNETDQGVVTAQQANVEELKEFKNVANKIQIENFEKMEQLERRIAALEVKLAVLSPSED